MYRACGGSGASGSRKPSAAGKVANAPNEDRYVQDRAQQRAGPQAGEPEMRPDSHHTEADEHRRLQHLLLERARRRWRLRGRGRAELLESDGWCAGRRPQGSTAAGSTSVHPQSRNADAIDFDGMLSL